MVESHSILMQFTLMSYRLDTHVKPLIWVEVVVEPHSRRYGSICFWWVLGIMFVVQFEIILAAVLSTWSKPNPNLKADQLQTTWKSSFQASSCDAYLQFCLCSTYSFPVPIDVSSPSFKSSIGSVTYVPDQDAIVWTIKQV